MFPLILLLALLPFSHIAIFLPLYNLCLKIAKLHFFQNLEEVELTFFLIEITHTTLVCSVGAVPLAIECLLDVVQDFAFWTFPYLDGLLRVLDIHILFLLIIFWLL